MKPFVSTHSFTVLFSKEGYDSGAPELPENLHWGVKIFHTRVQSGGMKTVVVFTVMAYFNIKLLERL